MISQEPKQIPQRNTFTLALPNDVQVTFDSNFESGNLAGVTHSGNYEFTLKTAPDGYDNKSSCYSTSWFYFGVKGIPAGVTVQFHIQKINIFGPIMKTPVDVYKAIYSYDKKDWKRIPTPNTLETDARDNINLHFSFSFDENNNEDSVNQSVYFAFGLPYTYTDCQNDLDAFQKEFLASDHQSKIYFHREIIAQSLEKRNVELLTISSLDQMLKDDEPYFHEALFPLRRTAGGLRAKKFSPSKKVVLISARVHPGETPASFAMRGVLRFLLDPNDARAFMLRKMFVFKIIPMLNPDGVANGYYRLDTLTQNLNRYYDEPTVENTPTIHASVELMKYHSAEGSLVFFADLHGHACRKGCFLYGNACRDFISQVETQLFAKIFSMNCLDLELGSCNFSERQMNTRDRGEKLTKDGCGRVVGYTNFNLIHSYTVECGYHFSPEVKTLTAPAPNSKKNLKNYICDDEENPKYIGDTMPGYNGDKTVYYNKQTFENLGKALLVSILDVFDGNPCSRIGTSEYGNLENLRANFAQEMSKKKKFRKEAKVSLKAKNINTLAPKLLLTSPKEEKTSNRSIARVRLNTESMVKRKDSQMKGTAPKSLLESHAGAIQVQAPPTIQLGRDFEPRTVKERNALEPLFPLPQPPAMRVNFVMPIKRTENVAVGLIPPPTTSVHVPIFSNLPPRFRVLKEVAVSQTPLPKIESRGLALNIQAIKK